MDTNELRIKIYERLGLEFGSLTSEGGNDWIRAEKEVIEEYKQQEFEKLQDLKSIDYLTIDKNSDDNLELIDGQIYLLSAPSVIHQIVVTNLSTEFGNYFKGKECRHFVSPFDMFSLSRLF